MIIIIIIMMIIIIITTTTTTYTDRRIYCYFLHRILNNNATPAS